MTGKFWIDRNLFSFMQGPDQNAGVAMTLIFGELPWIPRVYLLLRKRILCWRIIFLERKNEKDEFFLMGGGRS
jgi:hypothetical protein